MFAKLKVSLLVLVMIVVPAALEKENKDLKAKCKKATARRISS